MVSAERLTHRYRARTALAELTFDVAEGSLFGLLGPNGGGKSTLFRILATMMTPSGGRALIAGHDVVRQPDAVRRAIGVVFQSQSLDRKLTVEENLRSQGRLYGLAGAALEARAAEALERLGLAARRRDLVDTLSGGLRRRAEIAKALLHRPRVLLMDEPSTGLDPAARRELINYVTELREREGVTVLLTTHLLDEAERCDRLLLLHEGRKVAEGSPAELKARVGGDVVVLEAGDLEALAGRIEARFGARPRRVDGTLRVEIPNGHRFVTEVVEAFPGAVQSIALHKPTLEDVFLDETGVAISA
jgi:ABC-2 type transport system ATP-binding protein